MSQIVISGKRKRAIARATIKEGSGKIKINRRPIELLNSLSRLEIIEPLVIAKKVLGKINFDISVNVCGGGYAAQIDASRLAIAKAICEFSKSKKLRQEYLLYDRNLLVADTRRKETYKPGDSKARKRRQTSYR